MDRASATLGPLVCIVGARPNYMKMAPLVRAFAGHAGLPDVVLVHTGQHYDVAMNERLFADLELPSPHINLEVGSGTHAVQTAEIMRRFEPVLDKIRPSCVIVVGDVNSTLACSLVATKKSVPVVHVEAGLRSFDRDMPEEINRILTDQIADLLYTTERAAADNLTREGIASERIRFVGNVMIDSLRLHRTRAKMPAATLAEAGLAAIERRRLEVATGEPLTLELRAFLRSLRGEGTGAASAEAGCAALAVAAEVRSAMKLRARQWADRANAGS